MTNTLISDQRPLKKKAILVFARALGMDLIQRKFPKAYRPLLTTCTSDQTSLPGVDVHLFTTPGLVTDGLGPNFIYHYQQGNSFSQRLEQAVETLAQLDYQHIVIICRDCPDLELTDIEEAFIMLGSHRLVIGPDHRGGCYLIALHSEDRQCLQTIRWQQNTDCQELQERFAVGESKLLSVKIDLDTLADVRMLAQSGSRWHGLACLLLAVITVCLIEVQPCWASRSRWLERTQWQIPPPHFPVDYA